MRRQFDPADGVIDVHNLSKFYGAVHAVEDLSFAVSPGRVTGFLGPNGAGKTTTLRMILGLARPTSGSATIGGVSYMDMPTPAAHVGASLESASFHPGRSARNHLRVYAPEVRVPDSRCDEVLQLVGLADAADRRVGGYSTGMRQRLALATALLGDPQVLVLDEPANGLDPEGIAWLRDFLRYLAGQGRTVLVSSHMLGEVQQTVDDVVIIAAGRLVHASTLAQFEALAGPATRIVSPDHQGLSQLIEQAGWLESARIESPGQAVIVDHSPAEVGRLAFTSGLELHELAPAGTNLEELFLRWTESGALNGPKAASPTNSADGSVALRSADSEQPAEESR
jgi:ABC-2 type transport system ATP-binding protein